MQGLLSYSDDEDEGSHQPTASTSTSFLAAPAQPAGSSSKPRPSPPPPAHRPPQQAGGPPRLSSKPTLPPNLVRKTATNPSTSSLGSTSTSAYPSSPLRRPYAPNPNGTESPPQPAAFPRERAASNGVSEQDQLTELLRPPRLANGDGWEDEYGLRRMAEGRDGKVDEALQTKTDFFLSLKRKGTHFNDSLMQNKAFRNPTIYKKLVDHVGVDERAGRYASVWEWGRQPGDEEWGVERIADLQKSRSSSSNHAPGSRSSISFSSQSSSSSHPTGASHQIAFPSNPLLASSSKSHHSSKDKQASLRDALSSRPSSSASASGRGVVSGGKEYGFVGMVGSEDVKGGEKRHRDKGDREGKGGTVSRWG